MSLEAALDDERRTVLALLGDTQAHAPRPAHQRQGRMSSSAGLGRSPSPFTNPRSPARSLADLVGEDEVPPPSVSPAPGSSFAGSRRSPPRPAPVVRSMLDVTGPPPPPAQPIRSMLDFGPAPTPAAAAPPPASGLPRMSMPNLTHSRSAQVSPTESAPRGSVSSVSGSMHPRSASDVSAKPIDFGPRSSASRLDPTAEYQFGGIITNSMGQSLPKRNPQAGPNSSGGSGGMSSSVRRNHGVMAEVMRGSDIGGLSLPGDRGRQYSASSVGSGSVPVGSMGQGPGGGLRPGAGPRAGSSRSPSNRLNQRSNSPHSNMLSASLSRGSPQSMAMLDDGRVVDLNNAFRRLSDAKLAIAGPSHLAELSKKQQARQGSVGRLEKDYLGPDGEDLLEDSSEDERSSSDDDDDGERGRTPARTYDPELPNSESTDRKAGLLSSTSSKSGSRKTFSLLAAAEEERLQVSNKTPQTYRSLLDDIEPAKAASEKTKSTKIGVHPHTSFDNGPGSGFHTPMDSDTEADFTDIRSAQKLGLTMTPIQSHGDVSRSIRLIFRGEWTKIYKEAQEERRRLRKYLVATDLSEESTHALEWTIGTVLRDGDTLLAIYCVDEETGVVAEAPLVPDDPKAIRDQAVAVSQIAAAATGPAAPSVASGHRQPLASPSAAQTHFRPSPLAMDSSASISASPAPSTSRAGGGAASSASKSEEERERVVLDITDRVTKLLRKTRLQVRVIIEVIHCKSPKHLITEIIDLVNPTLVILGSRGRSALKGVILGSFSNYLVTKSSVPVMVARKRLRKQGKYRRPPKQINNLNNPTARSLANAKID